MRVFARGLGPGPKNVGIELDDGTRTVVTYRTFKYRYAKELHLSEKQYAGVTGIVQFDPKERDANGKSVIDIAVRAAGSQKLVNITIWPEYQLAAPIKKGDGIIADGSFETRVYQAQDGSQRESLQLSPTSLVVIPQVPKADREVVQAAPGSSSGSVPF